MTPDELYAKEIEDIAGQYSPHVIAALVNRMEEMAQLPRDGSIPIRKPGERCKYEESHTPSAPSPKTHQ